jgi:hypothetical protein
MNTLAPTVATTRDALAAELEDLWRCFDELFASLGPGDWSRRHGKDWTFADVPFHLAYFDRDVIAKGIERGANVPAEEQRVIRTLTELSAWNGRKFAERPAGQTPRQSLEQMRASRDAIRALVGRMGDGDLGRPAFSPLPGGGWVTVRQALEGCIGHTWNHVHQLRLYAKRAAPIPGASATHRALGFYMNVFSLFVNRQEAARTPFTMVMAFTGPGGGVWTFHVASGACVVQEGPVGRADLVMTQRPETFVKTLAEMHNPMLAMLTGQIRVRGFRKMGTFAKLFPPPKPDTVMEPAGRPAAVG